MKGFGPTSFVWSCLALVVIATLVGTPTRVWAFPTYAAQNGFTCVTCHIDPNGGGVRKDIGFLFARQRHSLDPDPDERWQSLMRLTNNLGDVFYFGGNIRTIYLYTNADEYAGFKPEDVSTFFQMQGSLFTGLRPHQNLAMVWNQDFNEFSGTRTRDLYGMVDGLPSDLYVQVGQFRIPFGLRDPDHTNATRFGFLNAASGSGGGVLPYDPRGVESGISVGAFPGKFFGAASLTNGGPAFVNKAQTVAAKIGLNKKPIQVAASFYDSYKTSNQTRATRWGAYLLWGWRGKLTLETEAVGGEDRDAARNITRVFGAFVQIDYRFSRAWKVAGKYDFADLDQDKDGFASERLSLEGVWTVVPFVDFYGIYRFIRPEMAGDENQLLMMAHFYY